MSDSKLLPLDASGAPIVVEKLAYSKPQAAKALGLGLDAMSTYIRQGRIKTFTYPDQDKLRVSREELLRFIAAREYKAQKEDRKLRLMVQEDRKRAEVSS